MLEEYNIASFEKRLGAFLIDIILMFIIERIVYFFVGFDILYGFEFTNDNMLKLNYDNQLANYIILIINLLYYVVLAFHFKGATLGKLALKIRVVHESDLDVSFWRLLGREVIGKYLLGLCLCFIPFIISIFMVIFKNGSSFHDTLFHTKVVDTNNPFKQSEQPEYNNNVISLK